MSVRFERGAIADEDNRDSVKRKRLGFSSPIFHLNFRRFRVSRAGNPNFPNFLVHYVEWSVLFFFFLNLFIGNFKRYRKRYLYIGGEEKHYRGDIIEVVNNWRLSERYRSSRRVVVLESAARCLITNCYFPASIFWKKRG